MGRLQGNNFGFPDRDDVSWVDRMLLCTDLPNVQDAQSCWSGAATGAQLGDGARMATTPQ